jgi:hypothetical protein
MSTTLAGRGRGNDPRTGVAPPPRWERALRAEGRPYLRFLVVWTLLNVCLNARYPAWRFHDPHRFWFLPSPDVTALFGLFCLLGWRGRRVPKVAMGAIVALVLLARFLRFGDGVLGRFFNRTFSVVGDVPLVGELARLLWSTAPHWKVLFGAAAVFAAFVALGFVVRAALRDAEAYLARPAGRAAFLATVAAFALASAVAPPPMLKQHRTGAFATCAAARLATESDMLMHALGLRDARWRPLREASARVEALPAALPGLGSADVLLVWVESYGHLAVSRPDVRAGIEPAWSRVERELGAAGYGARSSWLVSTTYGGGSWLAHASLASGARVADQFVMHLLARSGSKSMTWAFRRAGYGAVLAQPATTRAGWPHESFYNFERVYNEGDFNYRGPRFSWATMPDQFVLDFIHRREVAARDRRPLFIQYELVSSHGPFDVQPPAIDDWSTLGDGSIYNALAPITYPELTWATQDRAGPAYARAIAYDLDVLAQYLTRFLEGKALVIALGDHQPTPELTGHDPEWTVPIHVISRDPELLAPFERRGYGVGMTPAGPPRPLESLLFTLFENYSH